MVDLIFITGNQAKADYLGKWLGLPIAHQKVDLPEIQSLDSYGVAAEKARRAYDLIGKPVLVEDVALTFETFGRLPGTLVKWFLQEVGNDGMLKMLSGYDNRRATASIVDCLFDGEQLRTFEGSVRGHIAPEPRENGDSGWHGGLSWNSIFIPDGRTKTYAEMTDDELEPVSHRAQAIAKLRAYLDSTV